MYYLSQAARTIWTFLNNNSRKFDYLDNDLYCALSLKLLAGANCFSDVKGLLEFFSVFLVQMKELEEEWAKLDPTPPKPTRLTRSQQEKQAQAPQPDEVAGDSACGSTEGRIIDW